MKCCCHVYNNPKGRQKNAAISEIKRRLNHYASRLRGDTGRRVKKITSQQRFSTALEESRKKFPQTAALVGENSISEGIEEPETNVIEENGSEVSEIDELETPIGYALSTLKDM